MHKASESSGVAIKEEGILSSTDIQVSKSRGRILYREIQEKGTNLKNGWVHHNNSRLASSSNTYISW